MRIRTLLLPLPGRHPGEEAEAMLGGQANSSSPDDAQELELTVVPSGDDDGLDAHRASLGTSADAHSRGAPPGHDASKQPAAVPATGALPVGASTAASRNLRADANAAAQAPNPG